MFRVISQKNGKTKADYWFDSLKEAMIFHMGMLKKGYESTLERIKPKS